MKKILILFASAFLLVNCNDSKDSKSTETTEKKTSEKKNQAKKPDTKDKVVLHDHFDKVETKDLKEDDHSGWPEDRKTEILDMCKEDVGDDGKEATAYCNCQLNNAMKIFASYKEAMTIFNKSEDEITESEMRKLMMLEDADNNCAEQNYPDDMEDEDGNDEKDGR